MKYILSLLIIALMLTGCACRHEWNEAGCDLPKACSLCGETEGEALGHSWQAATCETPKCCTACSITEGDALGHDWQEATCEAPRTCAVCQKTGGEPTGHTWTDWTCTETDARRTCEDCEAEDSITMTEYLVSQLQGRWVSTKDPAGFNVPLGWYTSFEIRLDGTACLYDPSETYPSCRMEYLPPKGDVSSEITLHHFALTTEGAEQPFNFFYVPQENFILGYLGFTYERESAEVAELRSMLAGKWIFDSVYAYDDAYAKLDHSSYTTEFLDDGTFVVNAEKQIKGKWFYYPGDSFDSNGIIYYPIIALVGENHWSMYFTLELHHDSGAALLRIERPRVERTEFIKE